MPAGLPSDGHAAARSAPGDRQRAESGQTFDDQGL